MSSNTWALCMRGFTSTPLRAWSNATVFHNIFSHTFHNDIATQSIEARENLQLEDVNLVENSNNEFKKASKGGIITGDTQRFSTVAVMRRKPPAPPPPPGPNTGSGSQHD